MSNNLWGVAWGVIVPSVVLGQGHKLSMTPAWVLCVALAFPVAFGLYELIVKRKCNLWAILGFVGVLLTGGIGLLRLPKEYIAYKEALIPSVAAAFVAWSIFARRPFVEWLIGQMLDVEKIFELLRARGNVAAFRVIATRATWIIFATCLLSAALNYALACYFIQSNPGSLHFNIELGRMTVWSYVIIALPCTLMTMLAVMLTLKGLSRLTDRPLEDLLA